MKLFESQIFIGYDRHCEAMVKECIPAIDIDDYRSRMNVSISSEGSLPPNFGVLVIAREVKPPPPNPQQSELKL